MKPGSRSYKVDRNIKEKRRRMQMKHLFCILSSLIFTQSSNQRFSSPVLLEQAINYIKGVKERTEELQRRKEQVKGDQSRNKNNTQGSVLPVLAVEEMGSSLEVKFITGLNKNLRLHQVLTVLEEENVEVVSANYSTLDDKIIYTLHSQAILPRIGIETSRVQERLKKLVLLTL